MFDIGLGELLLLAVLGLLVFGPDKLPKAAADAGRMIKQVRQMAANAKRDLADSAGLDLSEATNVVRDLADLHPRNLARSLFEETPSTTVGPQGTAAGGANGSGAGTAAGGANGSGAAGPSLAAAAAAYVPPEAPATGANGAAGYAAGGNGAGGNGGAPSTLPTAATANAPSSPPSATAFSMAVAASAGLLPVPEPAGEQPAATADADVAKHRSPAFDPDAT